MIEANEPKNGIAIELTPLIDMVFLLLIFFLVATTFHQTEREMQIALPVSASAAPISTALREIVINVDEEGQIIISGRTIETQDLRALVTEAVAANPEQKVTVRGDRRTAYANIVRVLDICKGAGIQEPYLDTVITEHPLP
jgi:biopolymer transport protein ExbD